MLALVDQQTSSVFQIQAHHAAWTTKLFTGDLLECRQHALSAVDLYDIDKHRTHAVLYGGHDPLVCAHTTLSEAVCLLGYPDLALEHAMSPVEHAATLAHPFSASMAHYFVAQLHQDSSPDRLLNGLGDLQRSAPTTVSSTSSPGRGSSWAGQCPWRTMSRAVWRRSSRVSRRSSKRVQECGARTISPCWRRRWVARGGLILRSKPSKPHCRQRSRQGSAAGQRKPTAFAGSCSWHATRRRRALLRRVLSRPSRLRGPRVRG